MIDLWDAQSKLIYSVIVAGKSANFADKATVRLIDPGDSRLPFEQIKAFIATKQLGEMLRFARVGNYTKIEKCLRELVVAEIDLETCAPADLEVIHGIGRKTSRFFIMWIRPSEQYAALDVHVLRWMKSLGYDAPRSTPSNQNKYAELEASFIAEATKRGKTARELDEEIWMAGAGRVMNIAPEKTK